MKIIITESQHRLLLEQPDSKMPFQIEKFGYKQGKPETVTPAIQRQQEALSQIDPHTTLLIFQIGTAFIPVVGPFISAGIGLADAGLYLAEKDNHSAGLSAIFAVMPLIGPIISKIPGIKELGKNGMKQLADKLINSGNKAKLTKEELKVVSGIAGNKNLVTQELNTYAKKTASEVANTVKDSKTKNVLSKIATGGLKTSGQVATYGAVGYGYDELFPKGEIPQIPLTPTDNITQNISPQTDNRKQPPPRAGGSSIKSQQTPTTTSTIPEFLKNIDGVKKFQDWLDQNHPGWATGYPNGALNKAGGYGKFGPRTKAAWNSNKGEEYKKLNSA